MFNIRIIIALIVLILATPVYATDKWDKTDYTLLTVMVVMDVLDWRQTRYTANNPDRFHEHNLVLGSHPSQDKVDAYFAAAVTSQFVIAHYLPSKYRKYWLGLWIGISGTAVIHNDSVGIKMQW